MTPAHEEALRALRVADRDIVAFDKMKNDPGFHFSMTCFHAQQAIEKCMKAVMFERGILFARACRRETGSGFSAFADEAFARQFYLKHGTLCWPGERDVAAEYLYFLAFRDDATLQPLFRQWGYLDECTGALAA